MLRSMTILFPYPPSPSVLHWLGAGQLPSRLQRTVRLWVILQRLYGATTWAEPLPTRFRYADLRDRMFASTHPIAETLSYDKLLQACQGTDCLCQRSMAELVFTAETQQQRPDWLGQMERLTGLTAADLECQLVQRPFAVVHRSLRDDLRQLQALGWLQRSPKRGQWQMIAAAAAPMLPTSLAAEPDFSQLSERELWELSRVLESISFVQPHLDVVLDRLWQRMTDSRSRALIQAEPMRRIFVHLDYILPDEVQEQVDEYQEQIEQLWRTGDGGIIQFQNQMAREQRRVAVTVYPVCLHYAQRAKYLSAYGLDPYGRIHWHNYRLDRIVPGSLRVLPWGSPQVPPILKECWRAGELPTVDEVEAKLEEAWGFNFYLEKALLILRFPPRFARWYVDNTNRHPTFHGVAYEQLPRLIQQHVPHRLEQQKLLEVVQTRAATDSYYAGWIRVGDINVTMRLRNWRPNGEVIAPWVMRQQMAEEAKQELAAYTSCQDKRISEQK
jgi:CRISPR-associated protein (TIGR03985 family)